MQQARAEPTTFSTMLYLSSTHPHGVAYGVYIPAPWQKGSYSQIDWAGFVVDYAAIQDSGVGEGFVSKKCNLEGGLHSPGSSPVVE